MFVRERDLAFIHGTTRYMVGDFPFITGYGIRDFTFYDFFLTTSAVSLTNLGSILILASCVYNNHHNYHHDITTTYTTQHAARLVPSISSRQRHACARGASSIFSNNSTWLNQRERHTHTPATHRSEDRTRVQAC